jgi:hypothetical protein
MSSVAATAAPTPLRWSRVRQDYVLTLYLSRTRARHVWYSGESDVRFISARESHRVLGNRYREYLACFFTRIDGRYCPDDGVAMAYRLRADAEAQIREWAAQPVNATPPNRSDQDWKTVIVRMAGFGEYLKGHPDCAFTLALHSRVQDIGRGLGLLFERYRRHGGEGRRFLAHIGIQHAPKALRQSLLVGLGYFDVDGVNAHPSYLNALTGGVVEGLVRYCRDRERVLSRVGRHYGMDRSRCKKLFLALTFGARLHDPAIWNLCGDTPHAREVIEYAEAMNRAARFLLARHGIDVPPGDLKKAHRRALALLLQTVEDEVLSACEGYHRARGEELNVYMFDGYMLRLESPVDTRELSDWVWAATGLRLRFTCDAVR